jgi:hypothetical protein
MLQKVEEDQGLRRRPFRKRELTEEVGVEEKDVRVEVTSIEIGCSLGQLLWGKRPSPARYLIGRDGDWSKLWTSWLSVRAACNLNLNVGRASLC